MRPSEKRAIQQAIKNVNAPFPLPATQGKIVYLDPNSGSDGNSGDSPGTAKKSYAAAYAKLTANQNDVLVYLQGATSLSLAAAATWSKDYTHFLTVTAPTRMAQRARIFNAAALTNAAMLFTLSGKGCIFKDFYIFQGGSDAAALGNFEVSGGRNYFENVHFAGIGHATPGAETGASSLKLNGASECTFVNCTVGVDTIVRGDNQQILVDGGSSRITFEDCHIISASETAGACMVKLADTTALDRFMKFKRCLFSNFSVNHAATLSECFTIPASCQTHDIIIQDCMLAGITEWEANDRGQMWINMPAVALDTGGIGLEPKT